MRSRFIIYVPADTREATAVSFTKVAGVPLFLRSILALNLAGEKAFTVIAPLSHRRHLLKLWQKIIKNRDIHLNLVLTKENNRLTASELKEIKGYSEPTAYFINANYVLPGIAKTLMNEANSKIDPHEVRVLKPYAKRSAIAGFSVESLDPVIASAEKWPLTTEECIIELIENKNRHYIHEGDEGMIVQKFSEIGMAENFLAEDIRKHTPMFIAREVNKRISLPLSLRLARMRVTPNTITVINIFIGLCAGIGAAGRTYKGVLLGGILFQLASIIDGCDGEVAKLTYRTSKFGQYIDSLSDNLSLAAFLTGMMIHAYRVTGSYSAFIWGGALIVGALLILLIMADYLKKKTNSASFVTYDKEFLQKLTPETTPRVVLYFIKYFKVFFKKDCFSMAFLIFAMLGILHWWFYFISIAVWVAVFILAYLRERFYK